MVRIMISYRMWKTLDSYESICKYIIKSRRSKKFYESITDIDATSDEGDRMFFKHNNKDYTLRTYNISEDGIIDFELFQQKN